MAYVLLLLDNPQDGTAVTEVLEKYGCPLLVVCNTADAVQALANNEPAINVALIKTADPVSAAVKLRRANEQVPLVLLSHLSAIPTGLGRVSILRHEDGKPELLYDAIKSYFGEA